jgi:hypothetical protein
MCCCCVVLQLGIPFPCNTVGSQCVLRMLYLALYSCCACCALVREHCSPCRCGLVHQLSACTCACGGGYARVQLVYINGGRRGSAGGLACWRAVGSLAAKGVAACFFTLACTGLASYVQSDAL